MSDSEAYRPIATVDVALFVCRDAGLEIALMRRAQAPFAGYLALPGGYVHIGEDRDAEDAARRVLADKIGVRDAWLEQLATFSGPKRDPRGWSISMAYCAVTTARHASAAAEAGGGELMFVPVDELMPRGGIAPVRLAFDHGDIVRTGVERIRNKSAYSTLPAFLLEPPFTLSDLLAVYERVIGAKIDRTLFRRAMLERGVIEEDPAGAISRGRGRPAQLYRLAQSALQQFGRSF